MIGTSSNLPSKPTEPVQETPVVQSLPDHIPLTMPALSPTMKTGKIVSFNAKVGDEVNIGDSLATIETDKATMEFDTLDDGFVAWVASNKLGESIPIGETCVILVENKEDIPQFENYVPGQMGVSAQSDVTVQQPEVQGKASPAKSANLEQISLSGKQGPKLFISPKALKHFISNGFSKEALQNKLNQYSASSGNYAFGSGPNNRIISQDIPSITKLLSSEPVKAPTPSKKVKSVQPVVDSSGYKEIEMTNIRKIIADRLSQSKREIPHYYLEGELRMDALLEFKKEIFVKSGVKVSVNDFIIKAVAKASKEIQYCNSHYVDGKIRLFDDVDVR